MEQIIQLWNRLFLADSTEGPVLALVSTEKLRKWIGGVSLGPPEDTLCALRAGPLDET